MPSVNLPFPIGELYCDMDGVLVDFLEGARAVFQTHFENPCLGTKVRRWAILSTVDQFWFELPWTQEGQTIWDRIEKYNPKILSVCPREMCDCPAEKKLWCAHHLGIDAARVVTCWDRTEKQKFAVHNGIPNLLIDDDPNNIRDWRAGGGIGIHHVQVENTLAELDSNGLI